MFTADATTTAAPTAPAPIFRKLLLDDDEEEYARFFFCDPLLLSTMTREVDQPRIYRFEIFFLYNSLNRYSTIFSSVSHVAKTQTPSPTPSSPVVLFLPPFGS